MDVSQLFAPGASATPSGFSNGAQQFGFFGTGLTRQWRIPSARKRPPSSHFAPADESIKIAARQVRVVLNLFRDREPVLVRQLWRPTDQRKGAAFC